MIASLKRYFAAGVLAAMAAPAAAEMEINLYSGYQSLPHSVLSGRYPEGAALPAGTRFRETIGWEGRPFSMPIYYGARVTWWRENNLGFGAELTHAKAYAPKSEMPEGFSRLEYSDGHNILTVNMMKRWPNQWGDFTPYAGGGIGIAVPHVDVKAGGSRTFEYQLTGPAMRLTAGVGYALTDTWGLFGEYQFTASQNDADLDGGGKMKARLITNALNLGVSFRF